MDNHFAIELPKKIVLEKSREVMTRRNQRLVLPYYKPNRNLHSGKFAYHLLLLFYPFAKKEDLFPKSWTYLGKLLDPMVCATVNENKQVFEPNSGLVDTLLAEISTPEQEKHFYQDEQQESSEVNEYKNTGEESAFIGQINEINRQPEINYEELNSLISSLNTQQRKIFNAVQGWTNKQIKAMNFNKKVPIEVSSVVYY